MLAVGSRMLQRGAVLGKSPSTTVPKAGVRAQQWLRMNRTSVGCLAQHRGDTPGRAAGKPPGTLSNVWKQSDQVDVVIVGGGMVGLNTAAELARNGKSVAVLESRVRGAGQSGRTTAHIMQWHDNYYSQLEKKYGTDGSLKIAGSMVEAINFIEQIVQDEDIQCGFTRLPGYLFPEKTYDRDMKVLDDELAACRRAGMMDVRKVDLKGDPRNGGIHTALLFPRSAEFHPLQYLNGLAKALTEKYGVRIFEDTRVKGIATDIGFDGKVHTESGGSIQARDAVVIATNSPISRNLAIHTRQSAHRTYTMTFEVPKGSVERANWWSTADPYHYIRIQPGEDNDFLIVGGEDHQTGQSVGEYKDAFSRLATFTRARWPQVKDAVHWWSGQYYEPADDLGFYGLDPLDAAGSCYFPKSVPRYIATGDSGQGMTGSAIASMVIGSEILRRPCPWVDLYSPSRVNLQALLSPTSIQGLGSEVLDVVNGYGRLAPHSREDLRGLADADDIGTNLQSEQGMVVQSGLAKVALYRDTDRRLHKRSAICPHLGCAVEWNPSDKTFDCVCHGSIFDRYGKNIQGPSVSDLEDLGYKGYTPSPEVATPSSPAVANPAAANPEAAK